MDKDKVTVQTLQEKKERGDKITALTAYDYPTATIVDEAGIDLILVGDSVAQVVLGYETTLPVKMDEMCHHTKAVRRAVQRALLVTDMPFGSFQTSVSETVANATLFMKEAGAEAVKVEGAGSILPSVRTLIDVGIPVLGHTGFTPQSIHRYGTVKATGRLYDEALNLVSQAKALEEAGCFAIVLELVPEELATLITEQLRIPTIGIGAGLTCDGQILVLHDLIGLTSGWSPKHAKQYADIRSNISEAIQHYVNDVRNGQFPTDDHSFNMGEKVLEQLRQKLAE